MKIRIAAAPGELEERAHDVVRVLERLTGKDLHKAAPKLNEQIKQTPAQFEYKVLKEAAARSTTQAQRIQKRMLQQMMKVLDEVK
jgi:ribosomal protein L22